MFFEELGVLLKRKLVDIDLVDHLFGLAARVSWDQMKAVGLGARKTTAEKRGRTRNVDLVRISLQ